MKNILCNTYGVGLFKPLIVNCDNLSSMNTYEKLNKVTNNDWTYIIDNIISDTNSQYTVVICLFIKGRIMTGVGNGTSIRLATDEAVKNAFDIMFSRSSQDEIPNTNINKIETVSEFTNLSEHILLDKTQEEAQEDEVQEYNEEEYSTFDEIDESQASIVEDDNDDERPIPGSDITNRQIRFMNEFKEHNQIDSDEKFDYYIKTWASNVAVDDINTKKELIQAGHDTLENFIKWIKVMQPALEKGIVSPI